jgi:hypothetical protein
LGSGFGTLAGLLLLLLPPASARAEPIALTYSYSNLLDGGLHTTLTSRQLRAATEEALGLWAAYAPIHFFEAPDAGPPPSDANYSAAGSPDVRIGHHGAELSHAFFPWAPDGLSRDIHLTSRPADPFYWALGDDASPFAVDVLAVLVHELGHALGLGHYEGEPSIMNATLMWRYAGLGTAFLFPRDILSIQSLFGAGAGSVNPLDEALATPEPGTLLLIGVPMAVLMRRRLSAPRKGAPYTRG